MTELDRQSIDQAHSLVEAAAEAQKELASFSQEQVDRVVDAMARAALDDAFRLGEMAHVETGFGNAADKASKNRFSAENIYNFIKPMRTVGVIRESDSIIEVASPRGVIAAIVPSTNPTSTAIFKILISIKARNAVVLSPHPSAAKSIDETARIMRNAGEAAGLPARTIGCMSIATIEGTGELMKHRSTALILATGGIGLVRAAYSSGKPAFGVGPGNVPSMIERSAEISKAAKDILTGTCFDNGTICSSEQAVVVEGVVDAETRSAFVHNGAHFLNKAEQDLLAKVVATSNNTLNSKIVGKSAVTIAEMAGIAVPEGTRALICGLEGVGRGYPLSMEKLSPILAYYVVKDLEEGCDRCAEVLRYGGMGHTASIHTRDRGAAREYGIRMPASRIIVCSPSTHGAIGFTTDLEPSMTLGCGSWGGNVTSDNISPRHLMDIKRIAFETRPINKPAKADVPRLPDRSSSRGAGESRLERSEIAAIVDRFLAERVSRNHPHSVPMPALPVPSPPSSQRPAEPAQSTPEVYDFVCEDDVKRAIATNQRIYVNSKTIITPAARDLAGDKQILARLD
jgi:acetaldehyde dehydrogenase (acetylating)